MPMTIASVSCEEEGIDPEEPLSDLELIQQQMVGYWDLQKIVIKKVESATYDSEQGCDPQYLKYFPEWASSNILEMDFDITSFTNATRKNRCDNTQAELTFELHLDEFSQVYKILFSDGTQFQLIGGEEAADDPVVDLKYLNMTGAGVVEVIYTYKRL